MPHLTVDDLQQILNKQRSLYNDELSYFKNNINQLAYSSCRQGKLDVAKWLYSLSRGDKESIEKLESSLVKPENPSKKIKLDYNFEKVIFTDETFAHCCFDGYKEVARWIYDVSKVDKKININYDEDSPFCSACENGHTDLALWLYKLSKMDGNTKIDLKSKRQKAFSSCCTRGFKELAEFIYNTLKEEDNEIDLNQYKCLDFRYSCYYGHLEMAQWLLKKSEETNNPINIREEDDFAFKRACYYSNIDVAQWLCTLCPEYEVSVYEKTVYDFKDGKNEKKKETRIKHYKINDKTFKEFSGNKEFEDLISAIFDFFDNPNK